MKSTSNGQHKIDQSVPLYVWVRQPQTLLCISYSTSTQKCAENDAPRRCKIAQTCKQGPATSERLTRPLRKGVFECQASISACFKRSNVFLSHLKPSTVKLHHATLTAIRNEGCDCALTDTHETDTPRTHGTVADSAQRI